MNSKKKEQVKMISVLDNSKKPANYMTVLNSSGILIFFKERPKKILKKIWPILDNIASFSFSTLPFKL